MIHSIEYQTFDRFFGGNQLPGQGEYISFGVETRPLKSVKIFMHALRYIPYESPIADIQ